MHMQQLNLKLPDVGKHYVRKDVATDFIFYISAIQFVDQYQPVTGMW